MFNCCLSGNSEAKAQAARAAAMIIGSQIGDSAAAPSHWVYVPEEYKAKLEAAKRGPEFMDPPSNGFYTVPSSGLSDYGEQCFAVLNSVAELGHFDAEDVCKHLVAHFGKESDYEIPGIIDPENWPYRVKEVPKPLPGPWRGSSTNKFLENYVVHGKRPPECGCDMTGPECIVRALPVIALYAGQPDLPKAVEGVVRLYQNTDKDVQYALGFARALELLILGEASTPAAAIQATIAQRKAADPDDAVAAQMERAFTELAGKAILDAGVALKPPEVAFAYAGIACPLPASMILPILAATSFPTYREVITNCILAGGCNCSRSSLAGALCGAAEGLSAIPPEWIELAPSGAKIKALAEKVAAHREALHA